MLGNGHNNTVQILLAEDSRVAVQLVKQWLTDGLDVEFRLDNVDSLADGINSVGEGNYDLIILDLNLTDSAGIDTFLQFHGSAKGVPIVVLTGVNDEELAMTAVRAGAQDYVVKSGYSTNPLARAVRFSLERSKRIRAERELFAAEEVQATLYPHAAPKLPGFDIAAAAYSAAETCGDYFDFIPMANQTLGVVVGDVSGHGLGSALKMTETRAYLHAITRTWESTSAIADAELDLGAVLTYTNQLLVREGSVHFVTLFLGNLNPRDRTINFTTAGHRGYLLNTAGDLSYLETDNPILGVFEGMTLTS